MSYSPGGVGNGGPVAWGSVTGKPTTFAPIIGVGAADAVAGNDAKLTDARTPTTHAHAPGDVTGTAVVTGDVRLSDSRPASDVSTWAKAGTKPTYTAAEVGADASGAATSAQAASLPLHSKADTAGASDTAATLATGTDRTKLDGIAAGATVGADWNTNVANKPTISGSNTGDSSTNSQYSGLATSKQDTLVSATNIKTINGAAVLGSGDLVVTGAVPDIATSVLSPAVNESIATNSSAIVCRKYTIASGHKLTLNLGSIFRIL
jgi:hypothetical protein